MPSRAAVEIAITLGLVGALGLAASGCAPSLSTFQPASVAPKGHVAASVGLEGGVPVGAFTTLIDTGKDLTNKARSGDALTDAEKWQVFDAGVNLVLLTPSVGPHIAANYTVIDRLEVGVRYAGSAWRGGVRYQVLDKDHDPCDLTVGVGVSRFTYTFPISDQIPFLTLDDFSRWQVDVPILVGTSRDWFRVWAGPRILFTRFSTQLTLALPNNDTTVAHFDGTASFLGGQGGLALGYRRLFFAFELTLVEAFGTAHLTAPLINPPTHDSKVSSFTIFPALASWARSR